jgi:hypothetical protein
LLVHSLILSFSFLLINTNDEQHLQQSKWHK